MVYYRYKMQENIKKKLVYMYSFYANNFFFFLLLIPCDNANIIRLWLHY